MSDIVDAVEMPDQDGKSPGELWYGLPINPTLATHVWNGREWRPLLTEEGYYRAEITALRAEVENLQQTFDLRWKADQRAIKRWQAAHPGNDLTWPDRADMVVWLLDRDAALRAENEKLRAFVRRVAYLFEGTSLGSEARAALEEKP